MAAKAWASMNKAGYSDRPLIKCVQRLEDLESAATQALSGRGETTLPRGVHYRGRAVPSPVEKRQCPKCGGAGTVISDHLPDCPALVTCHYCAGHGKVDPPPEAEEELNAENQESD